MDPRMKYIAGKDLAELLEGIEAGKWKRVSVEELEFLQKGNAGYPGKQERGSLCSSGNGRAKDPDVVCGRKRE